MTSRLTELLVECDVLFGERDGPADLERVRAVQAENAIRSEAIVDLAAPALARAEHTPKLLELGIGYTFMTTALRWKLGDDLELYAVEHPQRSYLDDDAFSKRVADQRVTLERCDLLAEDLPWPDFRFDAILFADVVEHLPPTEVPALLDRVVARLAPNGRFVLSSTNLPAFYRLASLAFGNGLVQDPPYPLERAEGTYGHIRLYGRADVEILCARAGLDVVDWRYLNWEHVFMPRATLAQRLAHRAQLLAPKIAPRLATSWLAAAERGSVKTARPATDGASR